MWWAQLACKLNSLIFTVCSDIINCTFSSTQDLWNVLVWFELEHAQKCKISWNSARGAARCSEWKMIPGPGRIHNQIHPLILPWKSGWKNLSVYMEVVYVQFLGKKWDWATGPANAEKLTVNLLHGSSSSDMSVTYSSWKCENWD